MLKILDRLSKREKIIAYSLLGLAFFLIFERLVLVPVTQRLRDLRREISTKERELIRALNILNHEDIIVNQYNEYALPLIQDKSDEETRMAFQSLLERVARDNNFSIVSTEMLGVGSEGDYRKYAIRVTGQARLSDLMDFLFYLERVEGFIRVTEFSLSYAGRRPSLLDVEFTATKVSFKES